MTDETEDDPAQDKGSDKSKRLTAPEWREIEMLWEYGLMRTSDIAKKFDITPSAVTNHFLELKKKGIIIVKGAKRAEAMKILKVTPAPTPVAPKVASDFETKKRERIEQARETMFGAARMVSVHANKLYGEIHAGSLTWTGAASQLKALKIAAQLNEVNAVTLRNALDMATEIDEASMPILEFEDLTLTEIEAIQRGADEDDLDGLNLVDDEDNEVIEEGKPSP